MTSGKTFPRGIRMAFVVCVLGGALILIGSKLSSAMLTSVGLTLFVAAIVGLQVPQILMFFGIWVPALTTLALRLHSWMELDRD